MESFVPSANAATNLGHYQDFIQEATQDGLKGMPLRAESDHLLQENEMVHSGCTMAELVKPEIDAMPGPVQEAMYDKRTETLVRSLPMIVALCDHGRHTRLPRMPEDFPKTCSKCGGRLETKVFKKEGWQARLFCRVSAVYLLADLY